MKLRVWELRRWSELSATARSAGCGGGVFFSSRRRHTRCGRDWSSDVCSSDLRNPRSSSSENHRLRRGSRISAGCQKVYFDLVRKDLLSKVKSAALNIETGASKQFLRLRVISSRLLNFGDLYRQCRSCPSTRSCIIAVRGERTLCQYNRRGTLLC